MWRIKRQRYSHFFLFFIIARGKFSFHTHLFTNIIFTSTLSVFFKAEKVGFTTKISYFCKSFTFLRDICSNYFFQVNHLNFYVWHFLNFSKAQNDFQAKFWWLFWGFSLAYFFFPVKKLRKILELSLETDSFSRPKKTLGVGATKPKTLQNHPDGQCKTLNLAIAWVTIGQVFSLRTRLKVYYEQPF